MYYFFLELYIYQYHYYEIHHILKYYIINDKLLYIFLSNSNVLKTPSIFLS